MSPSSGLPGRAQLVSWDCGEGAWRQPREDWQVLGTAGARGHGADRPPAALQGGCGFWLL